jgi:hypothetical protein
MFLVRVSLKKMDTYVLTMCHNSKVLNYEIANRGIYFFFEEGPYMHSLEHLVDHYTRYPDGLKCSLQFPIGQTPHPVVSPGMLEFFYPQRCLNVSLKIVNLFKLVHLQTFILRLQGKLILLKTGQVYLQMCPSVLSAIDLDSCIPTGFRVFTKTVTF